MEYESLRVDEYFRLCLTCVVFTHLEGTYRIWKVLDTARTEFWNTTKTIYNILQNVVA